MRVRRQPDPEILKLDPGRPARQNRERGQKRVQKNEKT